MSIEEIRMRHEHDEIYGRDTRSDNVIHQDRGELLRVIDAVLGLNHYLCEFPDLDKIGAAYRKRDVDAILSGESGDE